jgi:hypothetical protein
LLPCDLPPLFRTHRQENFRLTGLQLFDKTFKGYGISYRLQENLPRTS